MPRLVIGALLLCLCVAGCSSLQEPRLIGTWQSDKDATLEILTAYRDLSKLKPEQRTFLENIFGKLLLTYDKRTVHAKFDTLEVTYNYQVVARNEICAVIESADLLREGQTSFEIVRFEGDDRIVVLLQDFNFPEVFRRVK